MAVANIAWILATNGKRVLVIDWDLEAPGLHRYFRPFLSDPDLKETPGLINFFVDFVEASRTEAQISSSSSPTTQPDTWHQGYSNLLRYAVALDHEFPNGATLDFVPAGRQGPEYSLLVNSFHWRDFYEKLGGGVFLELVKSRLREEYDFILIDSRTGLNDTSGICTVQMPDDLVVCFTLNRQSIFGSRDVAEYAEQQRRKPNGSPGLRIWPVPMRVELAEKQRLDAGRTLMRKEFINTVWQLNRDERNRYLSDCEVFYVPYYAYEEILATIAEKPGQSGTLLHYYEKLTDYITSHQIRSIRVIPESLRRDLLSRYLGQNESAAKAILNSSHKNLAILSLTKSVRRPWLTDLANTISSNSTNRIRYFLPAEDVSIGAALRGSFHRFASIADLLVVFCGPDSDEALHRDPWLREFFRNSSNAIIPVAVFPLGLNQLPSDWKKWSGIVLGSNFEGDLAVLEKAANEIVQAALGVTWPDQDFEIPDDPQKGRWGSLSSTNGRELTASVTEVEQNWYRIELCVRALPDSPKLESVTFHLSPTFAREPVTVKAVRGKATIELNAWGAFTVGAVTDQGSTTLELDLATLENAPPEFRVR